MLESISSFLAAVKAMTPQILIGIAIFCGVLLLSSPSFTGTLGLTGIISANRAYLGVAFVASLCILLSQFFWWAKDFLLHPVRVFRRSRQRDLLMSELTPDEKGYLLPYISETKNSQYFRMDDGIAQGLVAKGIIFQSATVGYLHDGWAYNLQPWARRYFAKHTDALVGASEPPEPLPGGASQW